MLLPGPVTFGHRTETKKKKTATVRTSRNHNQMPAKVASWEESESFRPGQSLNLD